MALCTVNGRSVIEGHISIPRTGAWHMDFLVDYGAELPNSVKAQFQDGTSFSGTIIRQAVYADYVRFRAVAGSGALYKTLVEPKHWTAGASAIALKVPLTYILGLAQETLSSQADQAVLNTQLVSWTCLPQSGSAAVRSLVSPYANSWRMLTDGTVWVGNEGWKNVDGQFNYVFLHQRTDIGVMEIAEETSSLRPGTLFRGLRITRVDNYIHQKGFRTTAHYFEAPT